ncbi:MAG: hypothetical protein LWY06_03330 [Firmicutes bacterium]|nr:hypothetical protein [Bacillota bacterium]
MEKRSGRWGWVVIPILLLLCIAGVRYLIPSWLEKNGYYTDEAFPSADGKSFYIQRILEANKLSSTPPPKDYFIQFINFTSSSSQGSYITTIRFSSQNKEFYHDVKDNALLYIVSDSTTTGTGGSPRATFHKVESGKPEITKPIPAGEYILENPVNIIRIENHRDAYLYDPLTAQATKLCSFPFDYSEDDCSITTGNTPGTFILKKGIREKEPQFFLYTAQAGKLVDLRKAAGNLPVSQFVQFETFDDRIINLCAFSQTPVFYDSSTGKAVQDKIDSAVYQISPDGSAAVCGKLDKYLTLYKFAEGKSSELYTEIRPEYMLRKYFWFPAEGKIIVGFDIRPLQGSFISNEISVIDPASKAIKVISPPCPAVSWKKKPFFNLLLRFLPAQGKTP